MCTKQNEAGLTTDIAYVTLFDPNIARLNTYNGLWITSFSSLRNKL